MINIFKEHEVDIFSIDIEGSHRLSLSNAKTTQHSSQDKKVIVKFGNTKYSGRLLKPKKLNTLIFVKKSLLIRLSVHITNISEVNVNHWQEIVRFTRFVANKINEDSQTIKVYPVSVILVFAVHDEMYYRN